jgi:hypothetical protein
MNFWSLPKQRRFLVKAQIVVAFALAWGMFLPQPSLMSLGATSARAPLANLESLSAGMYYQSADGWKAMEGAKPSSLTVKSFPKWYRGGALNEMHFNYAGAISTVQLDSRRPVFGIRLDDASGFHARDLMIIRLIKKKDRRELTLIRAQYQGAPAVQPGRVQATFTSITEETFTLTPVADLKPGQYIIISNEAAAPVALGNAKLAGYDFDVR